VTTSSQARLKKDVEHKETARHALEQVFACSCSRRGKASAPAAATDTFSQQINQLKTEISVLRDKLADESKRAAKADAARAVAEAAAAEAQAAAQVFVGFSAW
jgi:hypothetical protein